VNAVVTQHDGFIDVSEGPLGERAA
jgi:hypothetical protein